MGKSSAVLAEPGGIRVWRGFRSSEFYKDRPGFDKLIGSVFVPHTAQQMYPLGLAAYFPTLLPDTFVDTSSIRALCVPDEIALVVYPSKAAYDQAVRNSVAGRAYGLLHWPMFNFKDPEIPKSQSSHPTKWCATCEFDIPYFLRPDTIDWHSGSTKLFVGLPPKNSDANKFLDEVSSHVNQWLRLSNPNVVGSILCVSEHYVLLWEHYSNEDPCGSLMHSLDKLCDTVLVTKLATTVSVPPAFTMSDCGISLNVGDIVDVRCPEPLLGRQ